MPSATEPLYSYPLPAIEAWLRDQGCERDTENISKWTMARENWSADLLLDTDSIVVNYTSSNGDQIQRVFKYSLSRKDLEQVIFTGP